MGSGGLWEQPVAVPATALGAAGTVWVVIDTAVLPWAAKATMDALAQQAKGEEPPWQPS